MLRFHIKKDQTGSQKRWLETDLSGKLLLSTPQLNKGTAFSEQERHEFGLLGKLPEQIETLEEQIKRCYKQYSSYKSLMQKNIYLHSLHQTNEVLFYRLVKEHVAEMMPVLYTPIVGNAVKEFSSEYRQARGLYLSYPNRDKMKEILANRSHPDVQLIVTTDGEGVLGIGDQGIGAIDIPIAKLMVYSIAGGVNPLNTLPIMLDVGTNNQALLDDPMYLGWRHKRISDSEYDAFIKQFIDAVQETFPGVYLHWEDFGNRNARTNLDLYREQICSFNDDIQGTGVVTLAALLAGVQASHSELAEQTVVVYGAGSAGTGITEQLCDAMVRSGLSRDEAEKRFYMLNSKGLMTHDSIPEKDVRHKFTRHPDELADWIIDDPAKVALLDVVRNVKPTILIGCSTVAGAFNEAVVTEMAKHVEHPIIFPLSNPTEKSEAHPKNLLRWTQGKALIATGSPFDPVKYGDHEIPIAQCNNALVFPGIGLGILAAKPTSLTDDMLWAAVQATAQFAPIAKDPYAALLPSLEHFEMLSRKIALAVAEQAIAQGQCALGLEQISEAIEHDYWVPAYLAYKKA